MNEPVKVELMGGELTLISNPGATKTLLDLPTGESGLWLTDDQLINLTEAIRLVLRVRS